MASLSPRGTGPSLEQGLAGRQLDLLRGLLHAVLSTNRFYADKLAAAGVGPADVAAIASLADLSRLPFTTKSEIEADQRSSPPYGTLLSFPPERYVRLHQTSGTSGAPLRWLDTAESWQSLLECWEAIYCAAGVTSADSVFAPFSFGPFLGFWAAFEGALRLGMRALPGGGMSSAQRLRFLAETRPTVLLATPTYALRLAEVAREERIDLSRGPLRCVIVAGEPGGSVPSVRARIEAAFGGRVIDHWGMTEVGPLGLQRADDPSHIQIIETHAIAEVIDPATMRAVADGERGELVLTTLRRGGSPVIRYRTGDLVERAGRCLESGFLRLRGGVLGRIDQMVLVRGNNVYPAAVEEAMRRVEGLAEYAATVVRSGGIARSLCLRIEPAPGVSGEDLRSRALQAFQAVFPFRPDVTLAASGELPRYEMKARRFSITEE